ncbi:MAG: hypothetical protein P5702_02365 [Limnospira sp. PMC 1291.21]|uniref:Uncharacterized protein n=2 Tax=Limnospira TaxID=2596745 RepID=B5VW99_LIMMA|nr:MULTISPECIES: hypothetical protein [Limnospira]EKD09023.1 hypothetical protein SPLC1_S204240 [Arthrospira platensis C1]MDC0836670.1 hypothetical protein [Limnoraphis robusta]MDY7051833.1 hypothetical protein [Limnospira fusiformis LS22]QJB24472.1 hypothetical protein HFV01_00075 [Limnospira fusiformis SAG 85.79]EDZ96460.1 hypothetical protein AmaxDRAFT_0791 [Limnospira maxima CS-328]
MPSEPLPIEIALTPRFKRDLGVSGRRSPQRRTVRSRLGSCVAIVVVEFTANAVDFSLP